MKKPTDGNKPSLVGRSFKPRRLEGAGERTTVIATPGRMDRVRNAVFWSPGETIASLVDRALEIEVNRMEQERGAPFPPRTKSVRPGRPISDAAD